MLMARVKEDSAQPIIVSCAGRQFVKTEWRQVPEGMEDEAKAQPNLDTLTDAQLNPKAPKRKPKTENKVGGLAEFNVKTLRGMAKELGMSGFGRLNKADLIDALVAAGSAESKDANAGQSETEGSQEGDAKDPEDPKEPTESEDEYRDGE